MATWIIKSVTDDFDRALEVVGDQRNRGYTAWIEDHNGRAVDEETGKVEKPSSLKSIVEEKWKGALVFLAAALAALVTLYGLGAWVDH
jgi:hypothetical protein